MPSSSKAKQIIVRHLDPKALKIFELGSGWGGLAFKISKKNNQSTVFAFETSWIPWLFSTLMKLGRFPDLYLFRKNFYNVSLEKADVVVCYLYPGAMERLKYKFEKELKPGAWVISNTFAIPGWSPSQVIQLKDLWKTTILIYKIS